MQEADGAVSCGSIKSMAGSVLPSGSQIQGPPRESIRVLSGPVHLSQVLGGPPSLVTLFG